MPAKWNFIKTHTGGVKREASDDNYFRDDSTDIVSNLVRENIQNAIDAASGSKPVVVRFGINAASETQIQFVKSLLADGGDSVWKHYLQACKVSEVEPETPNFNRPGFLTIEDFNTNGLDGDIRSSDEGGFAVFWRNSGVTNKGKGRNRGGSFGIGKVVNPMSSRLQTFFGLTIRNVKKTNDADAGPFLMGQTMLCLHTLNRARYESYALYGEVNKNGLELPVKHGALMKRFVEAAGFSRVEEPGLSLAIPFPLDSFTPESISVAAIRHYFYAIAQKRLVVEIFRNQEKQTTIDDTTIESLAAAIGHDMEQTVVFTKRAQARLGSSSDLPAKCYTLDRYGEPLTASDFDSDHFARHKERFLNGELVTVEIPIETQAIASEQTKSAPVRLFLKKADGLGLDYYIRNGISLHENSCFSSSAQCIALLLSDEGEIAELLRKAEGPAHTHWVQRNCKAAKIYSNATKVIAYVKSLLERMQNLLASGAQQEDDTFLADDFPDTSGVEVDSTPPVATISRDTRGNLAITSTDNAAKHLGKTCTVTIWFESAMQGRKWSPFDFNLRQMKVSPAGTTIAAAEKNVLKFPLTESFTIKIEGFDPNKDLTASFNIAAT